MSTSQPLREYQAYVFDLDGTIYLGNRLLSGVGEMLARLRQKQKQIRFLSNKPLQTRFDYARKLRSLGVQAGDEEVINSSAVTVRYLQKHYPEAVLYVIGEGPLVGELLESGFRITTDGKKCDLLLLSFDRDFHYQKLFHGMLAAKRGVPIVATNPDVTCPVEEGEIPDCGAIMAAIEACSHRKVDTVVGKPSEIMLEVILEDLQRCPSEVLLIGDRLETDMEMGKRAGMDTALVLTGVTTLEKLSAWHHPPTYVLKSAADVIYTNP